MSSMQITWNLFNKRSHCVLCRIHIEQQIKEITGSQFRCIFICNITIKFKRWQPTCAIHMYVVLFDQDLVIHIVLLYSWLKISFILPLTMREDSIKRNGLFSLPTPTLWMWSAQVWPMFLDTKYIWSPKCNGSGHMIYWLLGAGVNHVRPVFTILYLCRLL